MCLPSSPLLAEAKRVIPAKDSPSPNSQVSLTCEVLFPNPPLSAGDGVALASSDTYVFSAIGPTAPRTIDTCAEATLYPTPSSVLRPTRTHAPYPLD